MSKLGNYGYPITGPIDNMIYETSATTKTPNYEKLSEKATRYNENKPRMDLIPMDVLVELAKLYGFGAKKYDAYNWAKGLSWEETRASLMRHLSEWSVGQDYDVESGLPHDVHVLWNAVSLVAMRLRNKGTDDRFKL